MTLLMNHSLVLAAGGILILRRQPRGEGVRKMPILLNKISTKGGRGGQKSPKSCLRRIWMPP